MKSLILIFVLTAFVSYGQVDSNYFKIMQFNESVTGKSRNVTNNVQINATDSGGVAAQIVYVVGGSVNNNFDLSATDFTSGNYNIAMKGDTLRGDTVNIAKDTITFDFGNQYAFGYIAIEDTSASFADTLKIEYYHPTLNKWSTRAIGLKDVSTNIVVSGNTFIQTAGTIKTYLINVLYPGRVRISFNFSGNKNTKYVPLVFRGNN